MGGTAPPPSGPNGTKPLHGTFCEEMRPFSRFRSNFPQLANLEHCFIMILCVCAQYIHACAQSLKAVCARTRAQLRGNTVPNQDARVLVMRIVTQISVTFFVNRRLLPMNRLNCPLLCQIINFYLCTVVTI